jgi:hypothetical protein
MNGSKIWHFSEMGIVQGVCGEKDVALEYNAVTRKEIFFNKPEKERCPHCEMILLRQENESLKRLIQELKVSCRKIIDYPI